MLLLVLVVVLGWQVNAQVGCREACRELGYQLFEGVV